MFVDFFIRNCCLHFFAQVFYIFFYPRLLFFEFFFDPYVFRNATFFFFMFCFCTLFSKTKDSMKNTRVVLWERRYFVCCFSRQRFCTAKKSLSSVPFKTFTFPHVLKFAPSKFNAKGKNKS